MKYNHLKQFNSVKGQLNNELETLNAKIDLLKKGQEEHPDKCWGIAELACILQRVQDINGMFS